MLQQVQQALLLVRLQRCSREASTAVCSLWILCPCLPPYLSQQVQMVHVARIGRDWVGKRVLEEEEEEEEEDGWRVQVLREWTVMAR